MPASYARFMLMFVPPLKAGFRLPDGNAMGIICLEQTLPSGNTYDGAVGRQAYQQHVQRERLADCDEPACVFAISW